jgi:hypothetical protein
MATSRSRHLMIVAEGRATAKSSGCLSSACCITAEQNGGKADPLGMSAFDSKQKFCPARGPTKKSSVSVRCLRDLVEARTINRCRRKRQGPNFSDTRGMGPNKDRRDSHGSIRQAHLPDAESEGGAGPTTEWDTHCKRDWPAPCLNQRKRGLSKQPQARRRE